MDDRKNIIGPYLDEHQNPWININVKLSMWVSISCVIDTGFSDGLALPKYYEKLFDNHIPLYNLQFEYANGEKEMKPIYTVKIKAFKKAYDTRMMFTDNSTPLVGLKFLRDYAFFLELKNDKISLI
ncbi:MAG: hypothetical protein WCJ19_02645 [bacterium]